MSRIGKQPIQIPSNVDVKIEGDRISVKGPKGALSRIIHSSILVEKDENVLAVKPKESKNSSALWGLSRALIFNMVHGVSEGYSKILEIEGVGYRAQMQGEKLVLQLGFSHMIELSIPEGISINVDGNTIEVSGIDKYLVGQVAANIRAFKKP